MKPLSPYIHRLQAAAFLVAFLVIACGIGKAETPSPAQPPPVLVTAEVDKAAANPGDIITFLLSAEYDQDVQVELPEIADRFSDFRILNSGLTQPVKKEGRIKAERWYKLQADVSGSYIIEPIEVAFRLPDGRPQSVKTPKIFLEIESLLEKEGGAQDIRDIKPPLSVPPPYGRLLLYAAVPAGIIAVVLGAKRLLDRYRRKRAASRAERKPAHEEAIEALEKLLLRRLVENGRVREFYFEISLILRRYLEDRFGFPAVDFTAEEIMRRVDENNGLPDGQVKPILSEFLSETDLVKFAKRRPAQHEVEKVRQQTITIIQKTTPICDQESNRSKAKEPHEHVPV